MEDCLYTYSYKYPFMNGTPPYYPNPSVGVDLRNPLLGGFITAGGSIWQPILYEGLDNTFCRCGEHGVCCLNNPVGMGATVAVNEIASFPAYQTNRPTHTTWLHWDKPEEGWHKINTDASWNRGRNLAGAGGVIRDNLGNWTVGFMIKLGGCGVCSVLEVELWAIFHGLRLAWDRGLRKVELETDSAISVSVIKKEGALNEKDPLLDLVHSIQQLRDRDWMCTIEYIPREKNMVADSLAKASLDGDGSLVIMDTQPAGLHDLMLDDSLGVSIPRVVTL